jgi:ATP-dependent helicase YprA (DUF1998 family)
MSCPRPHGNLLIWSDLEVAQNRNVERISKREAISLVAGEHSPQITTDTRARLEGDIKSPPTELPVNVFACAPMLEMGIDVAGLDAVVRWNVPPRPDHSAQRGGRVGRRSRASMVLG